MIVLDRPKKDTITPYKKPRFEDRHIVIYEKSSGEAKIDNLWGLSEDWVTTLNFKIKDSVFSLSSKLLYLTHALKKSQYILDLKDNWDDEGSVGYNLQVWEVSLKFVINYAEWLYKNFNVEMYIPKIYHGPNGSIDIIWEEESFRLFININANFKSANFFSDLNRQFNQVTEGCFQLENFNYQLLPLPFKFSH